DKIGGKQLWSAVKTVSVPKQASNITACSYASTLTATSLNNHFASVSTDKYYEIPQLKNTCISASDICWSSEYDVFKLLDTLKQTSPGMDGLPSWFLKLAAPCISRPLSHLFNL